MSSERMSITKRVAIYYLQATAFAVVSYGIVMLLYDTSKLSFPEWLLVAFVAFTVGLIPYLYQMIREKRKDGRAGL